MRGVALRARVFEISYYCGCLVIALVSRARRNPHRGESRSDWRSGTESNWFVAPGRRRRQRLAFRTSETVAHIDRCHVSCLPLLRAT